jgi:hypothetical protein
MTDADAASSILILNDSNESELGPGVFLDTAINLRLQPAIAPMTDMPGRWAVHTRFFDPLYYKTFGVTFYGAALCSLCVLRVLCEPAVLCEPLLKE